MPRYYFHLSDEKSVFYDRIGVELKDKSAIVDCAFGHIRDVRVSQAEQRYWSNWILAVGDVEGAILYGMTFEFEAVDLSSPSIARFNPNG